MSKATPRPWRRTKPQGAFGHEVVAGEGYLNTKLIAQMSHLWGAQDVSEANAELIVRAVNSHDKLVEVVKEFLSAEFIDGGVKVKAGYYKRGREALLGAESRQREGA